MLVENGYLEIKTIVIKNSFLLNYFHNDRISSSGDFPHEDLFALNLTGR